jgi:hypothetical protein
MMARYVICTFETRDVKVWYEVELDEAEGGLDHVEARALIESGEAQEFADKRQSSPQLQIIDIERQDD